MPFLIELAGFIFLILGNFIYNEILVLKWLNTENKQKGGSEVNIGSKFTSSNEEKLMLEIQEDEPEAGSDKKTSKTDATVYTKLSKFDDSKF